MICVCETGLSFKFVPVVPLQLLTAEHMMLHGVFPSQ